MYDEALLKELTELENTVRFDSFDFNDAYALGSALRAAGEKAPKPITVRIVLDGMILYQSFLPGTDATNNNWMDKKQRTVQLTGTTSLRAAVERELYGAKAPWQHDEEHYAFCGGGAGGARPASAGRAADRFAAFEGPRAAVRNGEGLLGE